VLAYLVERGVGRVNIGTRDVMEIMTHRIGDDHEVTKTFTDVLHWMLAEGLIRVANKSETIKGELLLINAQLTSLGIGIVQAKVEDPDIGETIEKTVARGNLEPAAYTKIGSFVGGVLGGFTKSISG
jgi:hypothetical protein